MATLTILRCTVSDCNNTYNVSYIDDAPHNWAFIHGNWFCPEHADISIAALGIKIALRATNKIMQLCTKMGGV